MQLRFGLSLFGESEAHSRFRRTLREGLALWSL